MSQSSWQIGRPDLNAFFLRAFFFSPPPEQQTCQIWVGHSFEIWNLIFGWTRYKTLEDRTQSWRSLLFKVFHCVCHISSFIFWRASSQKTEKKKKNYANKKKKKFKPWILLNQTRTVKQMRAVALRHRIFFFSLKHSLGLILINVLETPTTVSKMSHNMLCILKHDLFNFFCTELAKIPANVINKRQIWSSASAWPNQWCPISFNGLRFCLSSRPEKKYFSQQGSQISHYFLCISLSQFVKISLQMDKFPGNDLAKMPIFSHHAYLFNWNLRNMF